MMEGVFRHRVWAQLEPLLRSSTSIDSYLQAATDVIAELIEVDGSYSLSASLYGHHLTVATSDRAAWEADQVEFDTQAGPCVEALRDGKVCDVIDLASERRWPAWTAVASLLGFATAAGIPAQIDPDHRLALNMYARTTLGVR